MSASAEMGQPGEGIVREGGVPMDTLIDRVDAFAQRHRRILSIVGAIWFVLGCAAASGMVRLPDIPLLTDRAAFFLSGAYNAIWWGFLYPRAEQRRKERKALIEGKAATDG